MFRRVGAFAAVLALTLLAACTTTDTRTAGLIADRPPADARVLLVQPDIQLAMLTASGMQEPRAEWTADARRNMQSTLEAALRTRGRPVVALDPETAMEGRPGQLLRLNQAVGQSIIAFEYGPMRLPSKTGSFD